MRRFASKDMRKYEYKYKSSFYSERSKGKFIRFLNLLVLIFSIIVFVLFIFSGIKIIRDNIIQKSLISPVIDSVSFSIAKIKNTIFPVTLEQIVAKSLKGQEGTYAVVIKNLKTNESYELNQDKVFQAASLYKLWVMAETYRLIEQGKLDPEKVLSSDVVDLNNKFNIATDSAELAEGTVSARVQDALTQMIEVSSNYSALLLASDINLSNVSRFLSDFEFSHSKITNPPVTTAGDIADFYEKLYLGKLANKESTKQMLVLLKNQTLNDRIPKYLPDALDIGHKTGELDSFKHDAGIVYAPQGDYIIVIMSDTKDSASAAEQEALLSKAVYEYFEDR